MAEKKILIIDDEDDIREVAAMSLETIAGWIVVQAHNGSAGVQKAASEKPDAILLDVMMPDVDGPATLQKLRANADTASIPVIFLTAKVQSTERKRLSDLGVAAVLSKPFDPMLLSEQISEVLGWSS